MTAPANSTAGANPRPVQCARCGVAFEADDLPVLCAVAGHREAVHLDCAPDDAEGVGFWQGADFVDFRAGGLAGQTVMLPRGAAYPPVLLRADEEDAVWFRDHPGRCHRLRLPFPGELEARGVDAASNGGADRIRVVVRQLTPGVRAYEHVLALPLEGDEEAIAHLCFDLRRIYAPSTMASLDDLQHALSRYSARGGRQ